MTTNVSKSSTHRLVRQEATSESESYDHKHQLLRVHPVSNKQWALESNGFKSPNDGLALLHHPVSKNSLISEDKKSSPGTSPRSTSQSSRDKIQLLNCESSFGSSDESGRHKSTFIKRQLTTDSVSGMGGSSRQLSHQLSNASSGPHRKTPLRLLSNSHSYQGITLIRGASCSLVDIPTYLGPSLAQGVEVAQICEMSSGSHNLKTVFTSSLDRKVSRPRLQLDLTRKNASVYSSKHEKKTKWTVLCISMTFLTMCVTLVGTMLSVGSSYQDMMIAKQWNHILITKHRNDSHFETSSSSGNQDFNEETFIIIPEEEYLNETLNFSSPILTIIQRLKKQK